MWMNSLWGEQATFCVLGLLSCLLCGNWKEVQVEMPNSKVTEKVIITKRTFQWVFRFLGWQIPSYIVLILRAFAINESLLTSNLKHIERAHKNIILKSFFHANITIWLYVHPPQPWTTYSLKSPVHHLTTLWLWTVPYATACCLIIYWWLSPQSFENLVVVFSSLILNAPPIHCYCSNQLYSEGCHSLFFFLIFLSLRGRSC